MVGTGWGVDAEDGCDVVCEEETGERACIEDESDLEARVADEQADLVRDLLAPVP